ncbi:MAG TPA: hypothetical protein VFW68_07350 [Rhodocyclaceae bacterium]|nr:hypothetical protein [Rhodocyclaceae bacterium]
MSRTFITEEIARRRRNSARVAWVLMSAVVVLYALGFLVPR